MNRRTFLRQLVGGVAVAATQSVWPHRVYSFPSEIKTFEPIWHPAMLGRRVVLSDYHIGGFTDAAFDLDKFLVERFAKRYASLRDEHLLALLNSNPGTLLGERLC